jgi:hypothetical protein
VDIQTASQFVLCSKIYFLDACNRINRRQLADHQGCREAILTRFLVELKNVPSPFEQIRGHLTEFVVNPSDRVSESDILAGALHLQSTQSVRHNFCVTYTTFRENQQEFVAVQAHAKIIAVARFP